MRHIVKRHGVKQEYSDRKVYASVYAAALNCEWGEQRAEELALHVMKKVNEWLGHVPAISSEDIKEKIIENIDDKEVVLMYKHHLDIC